MSVSRAELFIAADIRDPFATEQISQLKDGMISEGSPGPDATNIRLIPGPNHREGWL